MPPRGRGRGSDERPSHWGRPGWQRPYWWSYDRVVDNPALIVGSIIGGIIGSVLGPKGTVGGGAAGAAIGRNLDRADEEYEDDE